MHRLVRLCANCALFLSAFAVGWFDSPAFGQTTLNGSDLDLNSYALGAGSAVMSGPGYLATYLDVGDSGDGGSMVNLTLNATRGAGGAGVDPHLNIVVADSKFGFTVSSTSATNYGTGNFWLPAGKYVVRTERDSPNNPTTSTRTATVNTLNVSAATGSATFNNVNSNANALAAADNYVANFRKGPATVQLVGVAPGTPVQVNQVQHAFNFGGNIFGTNTNLLSNTSFTNFFNDHFNTMVPSRQGKWNNQESTRDTVNMAGLDAYYDFAQANNLRIRAHNLIWNNEQPSWSTTMLSQPTNTDPDTGLTNLLGLYGAGQDGNPNGSPEQYSEVKERIDYYIGDGPGGYEDQAPRLMEIDVYNESYHTGVDTPGSSSNYWDRYGASGLSKIHQKVKDAVALSGSSSKVYVNEYNALQDTTGIYDNYANWYRSHIEDIENADGDAANQTIEGIGVQYWAVASHSATRMQQALQNLSITGLPISLTEHGVQGSVSYNSQQAIDIVTETMRMMFGSPNVTTHMIWGFWRGTWNGGNTWDPTLQGGFSLAEGDNLTLSTGGIAYEALRDQWETHLTGGGAPLVDSFGNIMFDGFYGDYVFTIGGQDYPLTLVKGTSNYQILVNPLANDGDFDDDGFVTAADIDILWSIVRGAGTDPNNNDTADLNGDSFVNEDDVDTMLASKLTAGPNMRYGDANLSGGTPELTDYNLWRTGTGGWAGGDFDGSGGVPELNDYNLWRTGPTQFPGTVGSHGGGGGPGAPLVPEPATLVLMGLGLPVLVLVARQRKRQ